ncbi:MAG TPA: XRE family transcriptional regulator [Tahibacter sp.]|nr:XRE family transcriptional regulator [Tahibacter sp.]
MPSQATPSFLAHVATNVRARRIAAGLSQKALADAAGLSLRMIGAIEAGSSSVSTSTLDRIGLALGASLAELVAAPGQPRAPKVLRRLGWSGASGGTGVLMTSLAARREAETWEWRLEPGERYAAGADPAGWQVQLIVVKGRLTLELDGDERTIEADVHVFASDRPHAFANRSRGVVHFFRITIC